jgi:hypothetical protein
MIRTQGRDPGVKYGTPTQYSDYSNLSGSLDNLYKSLWALVLDSSYGEDHAA